MPEEHVDIRQEGVWDTVKTKFGDASVATIVAVARDLALSAARNLVS